MRSREVMGKVLGVALAFVLFVYMVGGLPAVVCAVSLPPSPSQIPGLTDRASNGLEVREALSQGDAILLLVNEGIYAGIEQRLSVFEDDLTSEGYQVYEDTVSSQANPSEIRGLLTSYWIDHGITGAILIGDIRAAYTEIHTGDFTDPQAIEVWISLDATDMYYMDLDGAWEHVTSPDFCEDCPPGVVACNTYPSCDTFAAEYLVYLDEEMEWNYSAIEDKAQYQAEIWVSRIMAHNLSIESRAGSATAFTPEAGGPDAAAASGIASYGLAEAAYGSDSQPSTLSGDPPDLTLGVPEMSGLDVSVNGVVFPGDPETTITRINWDWGDGTSGDQWFPAYHSYSACGDYWITVTAYQSDGQYSTQTALVSLCLTNMSEMEIMNAFLDRDHRYRNGEFPISNTAYLLDALPGYNDQGMDYSQIFDTVVLDDNVTKAEFTDVLQNPAGSELLYFTAHSWPQGHMWSDVALTADELADLSKNSVFYMLNACSSARWDQYVSTPDNPNYMAGLYVFDKNEAQGDYGLAAMGFTGVGGFNNLNFFTDSLNSGGQTVYGEAFKYWFNSNLAVNFGAHNYVFLGDATIRPRMSEFPPEPPLVGTADAGSIGPTYARLNGELTSLGSASSVEVFFEWGPNSGYGNYTSSQTMTGTGPFSFALSELTPGTTYFFRATAVGDGMAYGSDITFTTLTVPLGLTTNSATNVKATSVTLNGTLDSLGTASYVDVYFQGGLSTSYGVNVYVGRLTAPGPFSFNVSGLSQGTTYHYRAAGVSSTGTIVYGNDVTFVYASPTITTTAATNVTTTSATLNGSLTSLGSASYVDVYILGGLTPSYGAVIYVGRMTSTGAITYNVSGLAAGTTYHYAVALRDNNGVIVYGNDISFATST